MLQSEMSEETLSMKSLVRYERHATVATLYNKLSPAVQRFCVASATRLEGALLAGRPLVALEPRQR